MKHWGLIIFCIFAGSFLYAILRFNVHTPQAASTIEAKIRSYPISTPFRKTFTPTSLLFTGDLFLGRYIETQIEIKGEDYPLKEMTPLFQQQDLVIANLEGPIANDHFHVPDYTMVFSLPPYSINILKNAGVDIVNLANNHSLDRGEQGYLDTIDNLKSVDIYAYGHSQEVDDKYVLEVTINEKNFIFIGFNVLNPNFDLEKANEIIGSYVNKGVIIVTVHWGNEYVLTSNTLQQDIAHKFINSGANVIIAHHPHVVQEIEEYQGKLIFYSLGNFVFDQFQNRDVQESLLVQMVVNGNNLDYNLIPAKIVNTQPQLMPTTEKKDFLERLSSRSSENLLNEIKTGTISVTL